MIVAAISSSPPIRGFLVEEGGCDRVSLSEPTCFFMSELDTIVNF